MSDLGIWYQLKTFPDGKYYHPYFRCNITAPVNDKQNILMNGLISVIIR